MNVWRRDDIIMLADGCPSGSVAARRNKVFSGLVPAVLGALCLVVVGGAAKAAQVEVVSFGGVPVKIVRGNGAVGAGTRGTAAPTERVELVTFGDPRSNPVRLVRGGDFGSRGLSFERAGDSRVERVETVAFTDPTLPPVTVVRGPSSNAELGLFNAASGADLDRVAFAVDGAESSHGADRRMWRPEPDGPQGPMQISLAAALDVGGGNRFDMRENRALGRSYLARLYQRYGNWPDAVAAYNWGPGNVDRWIRTGHAAAVLPLEVGHYVERVLRDALLPRDLLQE